ncbi:MAG: outer membrane protein [Aestuariivirga sp.]|uniref:outer membrane protein n=1 Tax=Aestuariivirga sp. TaxID=2650926 RepID=UPI0038CF947E
MKSIIKTFLALGLSAAACAPALAADAIPETPILDSSWYLRLDGGFSWLDTGDGTVDSGTLGGGVGYQFNDNLRTDLRVDYAGLGNDDTSLTTALGNVYFDIPTQTMLTPYVGAGVGYGWATGTGDDVNGVAFGLMAGVEVNLTDELSADVGYRYRQIFDEDVYDNQALIGLRYRF